MKKIDDNKGNNDIDVDRIAEVMEKMCVSKKIAMAYLVDQNKVPMDGVDMSYSKSTKKGK